MRAVGICAGIAFAIAAISTRPVGAQSPAQVQTAMEALKGTLGVTFQPLLTRGTLTGCSLVYDVLHTDDAYRQGAYVRVSGNISIMGMQGKLGAALKVVLIDVDPATFSRSAADPGPTRAYLVGDGYTTNLSSLVSAYPSDTPGALFSVFQIDPSFEMIANALAEKKATIAFNRGDGQTDIDVPLDLAVSGLDEQYERKRSDEATVGFIDCLDALVKVTTSADGEAVAPAQ